MNTTEPLVGRGVPDSDRLPTGVIGLVRSAGVISQLSGLVHKLRAAGHSVGRAPNLFCLYEGERAIVVCGCGRVCEVHLPTGDVSGSMVHHRCDNGTQAARDRRAAQRREALR